MRGKANTQCKTEAKYRITPAYAGKRVYFLQGSSGSGDHPRLCGEKDVYGSSEVLDMGSPPPMRGKGLKFTPCKRCKRITPAYAGKSTQILWNCFFDQDHPRLCGEKRSESTGS